MQENTYIVLVTTRLQITESVKTFSLQGLSYLKFQTYEHMCNPAQYAHWYGAGRMSTAGKGDWGAYFLLTGF